MGLQHALRSLANESVAGLARRFDLRYRFKRIAGRPSNLPAELHRRLELMRADNAAAQHPFRATALWLEVSRLFDHQFYLHGISNVESQAFNVRFFGYAPGDHRLFDYLMYTYFQLVRERDTLGLLRKLKASCPKGRGLAYEFDGCIVSLDLLVSIDDFYNLLELQPDLASAPLVVADIGAGWGRLGYVIKRVNPSASYIVFDLPESLLISSTYLPTLLPGMPAMKYEDARGRTLDRPTLLAGALWFLGAQDIERISDGALDLVTNVASFQEMTLDQVRSYLSIIDRKARGGSLYVRQLWSGESHGHRMREISGWKDYPFPPHWKQTFVRNSRMSDQFFEAGFQIPAEARV